MGIFDGFFGGSEDARKKAAEEAARKKLVADALRRAHSGAPTHAVEGDASHIAVDKDGNPVEPKVDELPDSPKEDDITEETPRTRAVKKAAPAEAKKSTEQMAEIVPVTVESAAKKESAESLKAKIEVHGDGWKKEPLTAEYLEAQGLLPEHRVQIGKEVVWFSSKPYSKGEGRIALVGYVEDGGKLVPRTYYRSNSQGTWRYLPTYLSDGSQISWYSKGYGEDSLNLPFELQKAVAEIIAKDKPLEIENPDLAFAGTAQTIGKDSTYFVTTDGAGKKLEGIDYAADDKGYLTQPETVTLSKEQSPNFEQPLFSFKQNMGVQGEVIQEVFESNDGTLRYMFCRDKDGRAWIGGIEDKSPIQSTGVRKSWVRGGALTTPVIEYFDQAGTYGGARIEGTDYVDMYEKYLSKIPVVQEYAASVELRRGAESDATLRDILNDTTPAPEVFKTADEMEARAAGGVEGDVERPKGGWFDRFSEGAKRFVGRHVRGEKDQEVASESRLETAGSLGVRVAETGLMLAASYGGWKLAYEATLGLAQNHFTAKERRELGEFIKAEMDAVSQGEENSAGAELAFRFTRIQSRVESSLHLTPRQKRDLLEKVNEVMHKDREARQEVERNRIDHVSALVNTMIQERVTAALLAREAVNTAATAAGLTALRGGAYLAISAAESVSKARAELKEKGEEAGFAAIMQKAFLDSAREMGMNLTLQGEGDKKAKGLRFIGAAGKAVRLGMFGYMASQGGEKQAEQINSLLEAVQKNGLLATLESNLGASIYGSTVGAPEKLASLASGAYHAASGAYEGAAGWMASDTVADVAGDVTGDADVDIDAADMEGTEDGAAAAGVDSDVAGDDVDAASADTVTEDAASADTVTEDAASADTVTEDAASADTVTDAPLKEAASGVVGEVVDVKKGGGAVMGSLEAALREGLVREGDGISQAVARQIDKMPDAQFKALAEQYGFKGERTFTENIHTALDSKYIPKGSLVDNERTGAYAKFIARVTADIAKNSAAYATEHGLPQEGFSDKAIGEVSAVLVGDVKGGFHIEYFQKDGTPFDLDKSDAGMEGQWDKGGVSRGGAGNAANEIARGERSLGDSMDASSPDTKTPVFSDADEIVRGAEYTWNGRPATFSKDGDIIVDGKQVADTELGVKELMEKHAQVGLLIEQADSARASGDADALRKAIDELRKLDEDTKSPWTYDSQVNISNEAIAGLENDLRIMTGVANEAPLLDDSAKVEAPLSGGSAEIPITRVNGKEVVLTLERGGDGHVTGVDMGDWKKMSGKDLASADKAAVEAGIDMSDTPGIRLKNLPDIRKWYAYTKVLEALKERGRDETTEFQDVAALAAALRAKLMRAANK